MTNFAIQAYLGYKGLYTYLNWHAFTSVVLLRPVLVLAMYFLVGRFAAPESAERYIIGLAAFSIPSALLQSILHSFFFERFFGTLPVLFTARGNPALHLLEQVRFLPAQRSDNRLPVPHLRSPSLRSRPLEPGLHHPGGVRGSHNGEQRYLRDVRRQLLHRDQGVQQHPDRGRHPIPRSYRGHHPDRAPSRILSLPSATSCRSPTASSPFARAFNGAGLAAVADDLLLELAVGLVYAVLGYLTFRLLEREAKRRGAFETF